MDTTSLVIGLFLLTISVLPFILLTLKRKKIEKKYKNKMHDWVQKEGCVVTQEELDDTNYIALDEKNEKLFFMSFQDAEPTEISVDLEQVKTCSILKEKKQGVLSEGDLYDIDKLILHFSFHSSTLPDIRLVLFNSSKKAQIVTELLFAREWTTKINAILHPAKEVLRS